MHLDRLPHSYSVKVLAWGKGERLGVAVELHLLTDQNIRAAADCDELEDAARGIRERSCLALHSLDKLCLRAGFDGSLAGSEAA